MTPGDASALWLVESGGVLLAGSLLTVATVTLCLSFAQRWASVALARF